MVYLTEFNSEEQTLRIIIFSFHQSEVELPNGEGDAVLDSGPTVCTQAAFALLGQIPSRGKCQHRHVGGQGQQTGNFVIM